MIWFTLSRRKALLLAIHHNTKASPPKHIYSSTKHKPKSFTLKKHKPTSMAEAALFSLASNLLAKISLPAFKKAFKRVQLIWRANDDLKKLEETITLIQAVLLDAERKHNDSAAVKNWIGRVRDVLYDAEDLFDFVATHDLVKQQKMKGKKYFKQVRLFFFKRKSVVLKNSVSKKVKAIRKNLRSISDDMALLGLTVRCESENLAISGIRKGAETGSVVGKDGIIGRDVEKKRVVEFVYNEKYADRTISLISIIGIGGMGKSGLAQLVYNDPKISDGFKHRYWACISDIVDEKEVLRKINHSMTKQEKSQEKCQELSLDELQLSIRKSVNERGKFLLVLDDLWDGYAAAKGLDLLSILGSDNAKGSKIIVTARNLSVAKAMRADDVLELQGLSRDASWELFRRYAFTKDQENDPTWISVGEQIASKCANVPLAIKSIATLLRTKSTIGEWRSLENEPLSKIQLSGNPIMSTLRLSYDHLPSYLKNCFAYCSLIPKDSMIPKQTLTYLWIAQGFIMPKEGETLEMAANACFMELFRRSFFQEAEYKYDHDETEILECKMHDLIHDLAEDVAGEESCIITAQGKNQSHIKIRHLFVDYVKGSMNTENLFLSLNADRLRTSLCNPDSCSPKLVEQFMKFRFLRALGLGDQGIRDVPSSIGEMKYLRYLDLSSNEFTHLPDSITKLVNLFTLDITCCESLVKLPRDIGQLISLRHLINEGCDELHYMPPTLGELTSLEHLGEFKVTKSNVVVDGEFCSLDALGRLNLRGSLEISWRGDEVLFERGHVPDSLEELQVKWYPSMRMAAWWRDTNPTSSMLPKLEHLYICYSEHVKHLPPLRCLPRLRILRLGWLPSLEFIEEDEIVPTAPFFPSLCTLQIVDLKNLKGWSRPTNAATPNALMFSCLARLDIYECPLLSSFPINAPRLKSMRLYMISVELFEQLVSRPCASSVEKIEIACCSDLTNFPGEGLTSLRSLKIAECWKLSKVRVAPNTVEEFTIDRCPKMKLWEEREDDGMSVDWPSFSNLRLLTLLKGEEGSTRLPGCLEQLVLLEKLRVKYQW